jgi:hypothetical protein
VRCSFGVQKKVSRISHLLSDAASRTTQVQNLLMNIYILIRVIIPFSFFDVYFSKYFRQYFPTPVLPIILSAKKKQRVLNFS